MHDGGAGRRCLRTLTVCLLLSVIAASDGLAGEWENMRESYDNKLRAQAKRIAEIEARERRVPADQVKRADEITRDRITGIKGSLKSGGKTRSLADTAERASGDARALIDVYREHGDYLDIVMSEWGTEGVEWRKLRESIAALQKSLGHANADLRRRSRLPRRRPCACRSRACSRRSPGSRPRQKSERDGNTSGPHASGNANRESAKPRSASGACGEDLEIDLAADDPR